MDPAKKEILERLQEAGKSKLPPVMPDFSTPIYHPLEDNLVEMFKNKLEALGGHVHICEDDQQLQIGLSKLLEGIWGKHLLQ